MMIKGTKLKCFYHAISQTHHFLIVHMVIWQAFDFLPVTGEVFEVSVLRPSKADMLVVPFQL